MSQTIETYRPDPVTIDGAAFYPKADPDGRTRYYIRQSGIPDLLRKHALEWWMGNTEREGWTERLTGWTNAAASGDGVIPAGDLLAEIGAINKTKLYGYQTRDSKGEFGTNAHDWLEWRLTGSGKEPVLLPGVAEAVAPAEEWIKQHNVEPVAVECVVFDGKAGVAGRIDTAARVDGIVCICDWKTGKIYDEKSKELYVEPRMQNHLYRRGWSSMYGNGMRSKGGWLLKLPRNKHERFHAYPVPWDQNVMDLYDSAADTWRALRRVQGQFEGGYR